MSSTPPTVGPYWAMLAADYHKEAGYFGLYVMMGEDRLWDLRYPENVAKRYVDALNAAYRAGQESREHSPDMVERVTRICKETLNAHGYDFPLDHDTPAMLDFRTHLASLFKPQP